ncbi:hypothetical protein Cgig2_021652 [Carnegiea gigantea]|uniref:Uncharacterized protein n=1 Tax=Carnegiea gigantea TaxID=171969 RepID=A0A9Q1K9Z7_9CARY|nr:hypothetical protein Cgig2_021652 [Carnegiea gigantea]
MLELEIMSLRRAHPSYREDDLIRGAGAPKKFLRDLRHRRVQIQVTIRACRVWSILFHIEQSGRFCVTRNLVERFWDNTNTFHLLFDPPQSMFYVRTLAIEDMVEIKLGIQFVDCADRHGIYATYLHHLMTHLVYFLLCFLPFYSTLMMQTFAIPVLPVTVVEALIPGLNIRVSGEWEEATYVDIRLAPKSKCPELPFPRAFLGITASSLANGAPFPLHKEDLATKISKTNKNSKDCGHTPSLAILPKEETFQGSIYSELDQLHEERSSSSLGYSMVAHLLLGLAGASLDNSSSTKMPTFCNVAKFSNCVNYRSITPPHDMPVKSLRKYEVEDVLVNPLQTHYTNDVPHMKKQTINQFLKNTKLAELPRKLNLDLIQQIDWVHSPEFNPTT